MLGQVVGTQKVDQAEKQTSQTEGFIVKQEEL